MITRRLLLVGLCVIAGSVANAQSVKLTSSQITDLLSGNTAVGKWQGADYRQYFDTDGHTIYAQAGSRSTRGEWRVDTVLDEYQSIWPRDPEWEGWYVMEFAGDYYWVSKSTPPTPFRIVAGRQLAAPDQQ